MNKELLQQDNELVEIEGIKIKRNQIDLIKRTIFIGATDDELRLFFYECARRGVHPMDRMIFPVVRIDKDGNRRVAFQTGIDYLRAAGEETGRYTGQKAIAYGPLMEIEGYPDIKVPEWAEVIVLRRDPESGDIAEIPHRAYWKEYYPGEKLGFMWRKMPHLMLGKCSEAGALRKGFPRKLGGLYINEEMERAEAIPFTAMTKPPIQPPQTKAETPMPPAENRIVTTIESINKKSGKKKDGSTWTLYLISAGGQSYSTFSLTNTEEAKKAQDSGSQVEIAFVQTEKGRNMETIKMVEIPLPEGCTSDPNSCDHSRYSDLGRAFCGEDGPECKYQTFDEALV